MSGMTNLRAAGPVVAAVLVAAALTACSGSDEPAMALGDAVTVEVGGTSMEFAVDDVREATVEDLQEMGASATGLEGRGVYFVTYSVTLASGDIADADPAELPVPTAEEWDLHGAGVYEPLTVIGQFDCTPDGNASNAVGPDAPLVGCQAFLSATDALPERVSVTDLGTWSTTAES